MERAVSWAVLGFAVSSISGCGTIGTCCSSDPGEFLRPYSGMRLDDQLLKSSAEKVQTAKNHEPGSIYIPIFDYLQVIRSACDLPLCAVADTAILPITIPYTLSRKRGKESSITDGQ